MDFFSTPTRNKVEIHQQQRKRQQQEYKHINRINHNPGHILYSINTVTGEIKPAEFQVIDSITWEQALMVARGVGVPRRVIVEKDCVYIEAMNEKNAIKRFNRTQTSCKL